jgi:hypothetical protein
MLFAAAAISFVIFTASINAAQSMGGPMNMSPSSETWLYIVLALDAIFLLAALLGIKLLGLSSPVIGVLCLLAGMIIFMLGIRNHANAPPLDGVNDTNKLPVPPVLHYVVYSLVGICMISGSWLMTNSSVRRNIR